MENNDLPPLAAKLQHVLDEGLVNATTIAAACGVTIQAVSGWKKTGRIAKEHLPVLATISGKPLEWWMSNLERPRKKSISEWDADTIQFAHAYQSLVAEERATYRAILMIAKKGVSDEEVERKMPITKPRNRNK
jgi:hypothetical protein